MKRDLFHIGAFLVLFLVTGVCSAQAEADLTAFNGQWIKDYTKFRNMVYAGADGSETVPERGWNEIYKNYTCMTVDSDNKGTINLRSYDSQGNDVGIYGSIKWHSGTNSEFFGSVEIFSDAGYEYDFAYVTVINGTFTAVPGYGTYSDGEYFNTWDFLWNAKIARRLPPNVYAVACGSEQTVRSSND
jgi:hypothetical protein